MSKTSWNYGFVLILPLKIKILSVLAKTFGRKEIEFLP